MINTLQQLTLPDLVLWSVVGLIALAAMIYLAILEGRHFRAQGAGAAWLRLRLASLPIVLLALGAVLATIAAIGMNGPQALMLAYMALLSVGTLVYFGLHAVAGRMFGLRGGQAAWIAFSGLLLLGVFPAVGGTLMPYVNIAAKVWKERRGDAAPAAQSPYVAEASRLRLPNGEEVWAVRYRAADARLVRVDMETAGHRVRDMLHLATATLCRRGDDLHLLWPTDRPLPTLHVSWQDGERRDRQSTVPPPAPVGDAVEFRVVWEADSLHMPAAVSRDAIAFVWLRADGRPSVDPLQNLAIDSECAADRIELPVRRELGRPQSFRLRVDHALPKGPTWAEFARPAATQAAPSGAR